jgi:predicted deacylase
VDPARLRGTLLAVPIVNTPGFFERSIFVNPRDGRNLNRSFPGKADGEPSEQVTNFLLSELIDGADAYVDAHCGDLIEALFPYTGWVKSSDPTVAERSKALAGAYGLELSYGLDPDSLPGSAAVNAALNGVPAIIAEIGQQGICDEVSVGRHLRGLQNVMAHLGMIDPLGAAPTLPEQLDGMVVTGTEQSGTYHPTVHVGDRVIEGAPIGELRDLFGDTVEEIHAPASGIVLFCMTALAVKKGDPLIGIGVTSSS